MPKPINPNLPLQLKEHTKGLADAAAYRLSLSLKEAANKIKASDRGAALKKNGWKCTTVLKQIVVDRKHYRHKFNTNPWLGNEPGKGNEYTVEDQVWRLISFSHKKGEPAEWFLAHHKGANNMFEFWHISDANSFKPKPVAKTPVAATPSFTTKELFDDQHGVTQEIFTTKTADSSPAVPDSWEDL